MNQATKTTSPTATGATNKTVKIVQLTNEQHTILMELADAELARYSNPHMSERAICIADARKALELLVLTVSDALITPATPTHANS